LGHPAVTTVVVGCRSKTQLEESIQMFAVDIPRALWEELTAEGLLPADVPTP
jgi:aryl-alcohol dehydrogenase-like predicted oxidoreductase